MKIKILILTVSLILGVTLTSAQLEFKTEEPIDAYSNFNFNQNTITNLTVPNSPAGGEAITQRYLSTNYLQRDGGVLKGTLYANGENIVGVDELQLEGGTNITGDLNVSESVEIDDGLKINRGGNSIVVNGTGMDHAFQEWYVNSSKPNQRSGWLGYGTGSNSHFTINNEEGNKIRLRGANIDISGGDIKLQDGYDLRSKNPSRNLIRRQNGRTEIGDGNDVTRLQGSTVRVPNGNIDAAGNNITSSGGEMCIGEYC